MRRARSCRCTSWPDRACPPPRPGSAASLWPLVPSAILFQPTADTAFPLLSTSALALAAHAGRSGRAGDISWRRGRAWCWRSAWPSPWPSCRSASPWRSSWPAPRDAGLRRGALSIVATGVGFLAATLAAWGITGANPFVVWWWNGRNHARFYEEYARSYPAWVVANPIELTLALGLAASTWALIGLLAPRRAPRAAWAALAVLLVLNFSGRNLSEVARLWLPFMPPLLTATGPGLARLGGGPKTLAASVMLQGAQTLILQAAIQVVYPT